MNNEIPGFLSQYFPILVFMGIALFLSCLITLLPFILALNKPDSSKLSQYECGFEPLSEARKKIDVKFYLVALLFIIFDLEVIFLFPWAVTLGVIGDFGFWSMILFLVILTVGFVYEWKKGALDWD